MDGAEGTYRLYVVAAQEPMPELEALYERHQQKGIRLDRRKAQALLQARLDALADGQVGGAEGWRFEFAVR